MYFTDRRSFLSGMGAACLALAHSTAPSAAQSRPTAQSRGNFSPSALKPPHGFAPEPSRAPVPPQTPAGPPAPFNGRPHDFALISRVQTALPQLALTFDDGPHPTNTPALLDILARHNARATFYLIGERVARYSELTRRIVAEGHEVGNHTWTHRGFNRLSDAAILEDIDRAQMQIWEVTGQVPVTLRPPYGTISRGQSEMILRERNLASVIWSVDPEDWRRPGVNVVSERVLRGARPGAIILSHDIHAPTIRAYAAVLERLSRDGFRPVTVSELVGWGGWGPHAEPLRSSFDTQTQLSSQG